MWPTVKTLKANFTSSRVYTVKVPGGPGSDGLYEELQDWVLSLLKPGQQKALVAYAGRVNLAAPPTFDNGGFSARQRPRRSESDQLRLRYDGSREQQIVVRGHKVKISVSDGNPAAGDGGKWKPPEIQFVAKSMAARDAVIEEIASVLKASRAQSKIPLFRMLNQWDEWERIDDLPARTLESVVLPGGQLERILGDVDQFLKNEDLYIKRSLPWHRGLLFEGPPGTGKTSVARAVASHFGLDIWYLPLADVKKDTSLIKTVMSVKSKSVLLLEDVDVFHAATSREEGFGGTTLSGLLNALDGIATPHGLITIMTSNKPETLDEALIRSGRVSTVEHFGLAGPDEISRLLSHWYGETVKIGVEGVEMIPSDVTDICTGHENAEDAVAEILSRMTGG